MSKIKWFEKQGELFFLYERMLAKEITNRDQFFFELSNIFPEEIKTFGVDERTIAFLEFLFMYANGPYSKKFEEAIPVIRDVFSLYPPLRRMIDDTANRAVANMVLGARGKLKFKIADRFELIKVINSWPEFGLRPISKNGVFRAIINKPSISKKIDNRDIYLLARLKAIFPFRYNKIIPNDFNLEEAIFKFQRPRFENLIEEAEKESKDINSLIDHENNRKMPVGIKRNNFLAYLVKLKNNFNCQLCHLRNELTHDGIETHHIIPLSKGGEDHSSNMIVLCHYHHKAHHKNLIDIETRNNKIKITAYGKSYNILTN